MIARRVAFQAVVVVLTFVAAGSPAAANEVVARDARRAVLTSSIGTYAGQIRLPNGRMDCERLIAELSDMHANTYNWLIARADTDWDDLHAFLPLAKAKNIRVWATVLPPSESLPRGKHNSEPFRLDYEKWAAELAALSVREPALVAMSIDDFAHNLSTFTPEAVQKIVAAAHAKNDRFVFVPCVYYKQATPAFAEIYGPHLDGILFPYRSESTKSGFTDATQVETEVRTLKKRFGNDFPIIVDVYASRHSTLGSSTTDYVTQLMELAHPVADGVHIYCHQNQNNPNEREKYDAIRRVMRSWPTKKNDR